MSPSTFTIENTPSSQNAPISLPGGFGADTNSALGESGTAAAVHTASVFLSSAAESADREICRLHYLIADPTGNITILVTDPVPVFDQANAAAALMKLEPSAEQVGFLTIPDSNTSASENCDIALRMAGGEFCGNASMSAAAFQAWRTGRKHGQFVLRVSGTDTPVMVNIEAEEKPLTWSGQVTMPLPRKIEMVSFPDGEQFPVVTFDGISHVIVQDMQGAPVRKNGIESIPAEPERFESVDDRSEKEWAEEHAREWCRFLQADALGILFLNESADRLTPLVYVPGADTLFWETSCGSGSAAAGAWLASQKSKEVSVSLKQPGGTLEVTASPGGPLLLKGTVVFI